MLKVKGATMLKMEGAVQHYDWGRVGHGSEVARLYALSSGKEVEEEKPYAELWMGTHPSAPSLISEDGEEASVLLTEWLQKHPEALGEAVLRKWGSGSELPFLFKVLSVAKALSIQAHPDKQLAEQLFRSQPKIYKDPNHKPEMALAVTDFDVLCGFLGPAELKQTLESFPDLRSLLFAGDVEELLGVDPSRGPTEASKAALVRAFTTVMNLEKKRVADAVRGLTQRLAGDKGTRKLSSKEELLLVLEKQYPDDVGVLAALFLNYVRLRPGEAVYLAANVPHAYISGECVECMAASDNVVRAGLTPKFRDTATLSSMLTYDQGPPHLLGGHPVSDFVKRYSPPFEEFEVDLISVPAGGSLDFAPIPGPSVFLVFGGTGSATFREGDSPSVVRKGDIFFLPAGKGFTISGPAQDGVAHENGNGKENGNQGHMSTMPPGWFKLGGSVYLGDSSLRLYRAGVNSSVL